MDRPRSASSLAGASAVAAALFFAGPRAAAQDPAKLVPGLVRVEDAHVRVLTPRYKPGEGMAMHEHPRRVIVYLTDARVQLTLPDGRKSTVERKAGMCELTPATKHAVKNVGDAPLECVEVELRAQTDAQPLGDAVAEDPTHTALVIEDDRVRVFRTRLLPGQVAPMHGHGERVTVILSGDRMRTRTEGGGVTESDLPAGDVSVRPPTRHEATNIGAKLHDAITIELKPAVAQPR